MSAFRFGLGHLALDFVATVGGRGAQPVEKLAAPGDLDGWLAEADLVDGRRPPRTGDGQLAEARELREAIYRVLEQARRSVRPAPADVALVNGWARRPEAAPQIGPRLERTTVAADPVAAALARLARAGVELVTGPDIERVRRCDGCSLLFLDRSRPGRRRWCSMQRCGNRSKTARYRASHADLPAPRGGA